MGHNCVMPQTSWSNDHHAGRDPVRTKIVVDNKIIEQVNLFNSLGNIGDRGSTVVRVLCYKSEGRWFDPSWCHWIFHWHKSFRLLYGPGVDSASNRNEYQKYFLGVKAAGA